MGASVQVHVDKLASVQARLVARWNKLNKEITKALLTAGLIVQTEARRNIQKSPRGGKQYKKYKPRRDHKASAPGESPATDTGMLASSITVRLHPDMLAVAVVSANAIAPYSLPLEFGTADGKIKPRPFMRPALEAKGAEASAIIAAAVKRVLEERS